MQTDKIAGAITFAGESISSAGVSVGQGLAKLATSTTENAVRSANALDRLSDAIENGSHTVRGGLISLSQGVEKAGDAYARTQTAQSAVSAADQALKDWIARRAAKAEEGR